MGKFAVIDTETNWHDQVMSIGTVIADTDTFRSVSLRYHIFPQECSVGGMYESTLYIDTPVKPILCTRREGLADIRGRLEREGVEDIFAYNACFDYNHLPELRDFRWHDIMALAAYRQYNRKIPSCAECFSTGRLKRGYGVEAMLRLLSGNKNYRESHNACRDAMEELDIMRLLGQPISDYNLLR